MSRGRSDALIGFARQVRGDDARDRRTKSAGLPSRAEPSRAAPRRVKFVVNEAESLLLMGVFFLLLFLLDCG